MKLLKQNKTFRGYVKYYEHDSVTTQTPMKFSIFIPELDGQESAPVLFWLSGLTCTEENFMAKAGAQQWADKYGVIIVCPDTSPRGLDLPGEHDDWDFGSGAGFYVNATQAPWSGHYQMDDYVAQELFDLIVHNFPADIDRAGIFGHSMGGHGALVLGLRNPKKFQTISAFAPICAPTQCPWGIKAFSNYLGEDRDAWKAYDASILIKEAESLPPIMVDQGTDDEFLAEQLKTDVLERACRDHVPLPVIRYQEGYDHSYYFISTFVHDHIAFHARHLKSE